MTPTLEDILDLLEEVAPSGLAASWDNPGLQVGRRRARIGKIHFALDPTPAALKSAGDQGCELLLTHHPLIFRPVSCLDLSAYPGNVILDAVKSDISVVSVHTNLDAARGGINDILADLMGLASVEVLEEMDGMPGAGMGRIGRLPRAMEVPVFAEKVKRVTGCLRVGVAGPEDTVVRRVAIVGGSGGSFVSLASEKGADLLLTGDVGHHHALSAESAGMVLMDAGHFNTERTAFEEFARRMAKRFEAKGWAVSVSVHPDRRDPLRQA